MTFKLMLKESEYKRYLRHVILDTETKTYVSKSSENKVNYLNVTAKLIVC